jgi:uncharacterized damage-inducible protein DinB
MILESILKLFRHMEWADALVWSVVLSSEAARKDSDVIKRLRHTHTVQNAFLNTWKGNQHASNAGDSLTLVELLQWARNFHVMAQEYIGSLAEESLEKQIVVPWSRGIEQRIGRPASITTLGDTALQTVLHSTQHRGQVTLRLHELGIERTLTDFIVWLWIGQPKPDWPSDTIK